MVDYVSLLFNQFFYFFFGFFCLFMIIFELFFVSGRRTVPPLFLQEVLASVHQWHWLFSWNFFHTYIFFFFELLYFQEKETFAFKSILDLLFTSSYNSLLTVHFPPSPTRDPLRPPLLSCLRLSLNSLQFLFQTTESVFNVTTIPIQWTNSLLLFSFFLFC